MADRLRELLLECAEFNGWHIDELNIQIDHVHMLVRLDPKTRVCDAVQKFKGGSSRIVRKEFSKLKEFLWGTSFWSDGYFAETVGKFDISIIKNYIQNQ